MKPAIRFFSFLCFVFLFANRLFAQAPGDLDTSFHIRTNYGALFPIEKAWPLADGSIMCYTAGGNYFSGKKTGNYFKIKPDGELDHSYQSPAFRFNYHCDFCYCGFTEHSAVTQNGLVYLKSTDGIITDGIAIPKSFIRLGINGEPDTTLVQPYLDSDYLYSLKSEGLLRLSGKRIQYYSNNYQPDTIRGDFRLDSVEYVVNGSVYSNDSITGFQIDSSGIQFNLFYNHNKFTFSPKTRKKKLKGITPSSVGLDPESRSYDFYFRCDTINGSVFSRIVRSHISGVPDTIFRAQDPEYPLGPDYFRFDPDGYLTKPYGYLGKRIRFDKTTGANLDTITPDGLLRIQTENAQIKMGISPGNRWFFESQSGPVVTHKETQFGPNGAIRHVTADVQGRAVIAGDFTEIDGYTFPWLARIGKNGFVDTTFQCKAFQPSDNGRVVFLNQDRINQQILVFLSKPSGNMGRFMFKFNSSGSIDSNFAQTNLSGFPNPIKEIFGGARLDGGSILLTVRFDDMPDTMNSYLIKLRPNGERDPGFQIRSSTEIFPSSPSWCRLTLKSIQILNSNMIQFTQSGYCSGGDEPPCKSGGEILHPFTFTSQIFDTTGNELPLLPCQSEGSSIRPIPELDTHKYALFILLQPPYPFLSATFRVSENFGIDSTFRTQYPNGSYYYGRPVAQTSAKELLLFNETEFANQPFQFQMQNFPFSVQQIRLTKTNPQGVLDTLFAKNLFYPGVTSIAEPDSSHLYIAGNFQVRNYEVVPPIVRIHNARSTVTANIRKRSEHRPYLPKSNPGNAVSVGMETRDRTDGDQCAGQGDVS